jgi:hypothetical protein
MSIETISPKRFKNKNSKVFEATKKELFLIDKVLSIWFVKLWYKYILFTIQVQSSRFKVRKIKYCRIINIKYLVSI